MTQRNSPERKAMLAARRIRQLARTPCFTPMSRKPRSYLKKDWDPVNPARRLSFSQLQPWEKRELKKDPKKRGKAYVR